MLKITLIACGNKMPNWVEQAVSEFSKRLQEYAKLTIVQIPLVKRSNTNNLARILDHESALILAAIPTSARVIAFDMAGESFSSEQLAVKLATLQHITSHLCLIIGGPEGLSSGVLARTHERWSLSSLTLPHPLVRIIVLEALYRAWAIINNHPYHK